VDVRNDLLELKQELASSQIVTSSPPRGDAGARRQQWIPWTVAGLMALVAAIAFVARPPAADASREVLSLLPPHNTTLTDGEAPQISPDGRFVGFVATDDSGRTLLYVRDRGSLVAQPLLGTDDATQPFWSRTAARSASLLVGN
jgi:hypothetical protein